MSVKMRLARGGAKKRPYYYIVIANGTAPRDGRYIEQIGTFNPMLKKDDPTRVSLNVERAAHWLKCGARFLDAAGLMKRTASNSPEKMVPKKKAQERAAAKAKAAEAAATAAAAAE